jgi:type I restriction enzyme S subunit
MNIEGWTRKSLGSFTQFIKGITYASEDYCKEDEGAIFLTIKCVSKSGGFKLEGIKYYRGIIHENEKLKEGDILISNTDLTRDGDIVGCPIMVPFLGTNEVTMSMDLSKLVIDSFQIDSKFLYYKLMTDKVRRFMQDHASGSTVLHLQTKAVPTLELLIPDKKEEQEKIAEILSTIDRAIAQTEAIIAKQQRIKTGLMQDLLTKGIDENGNIRSEATHKFKDSAIGRIPVEWEVETIGKIASLQRGHDIREVEFIAGDYPVIASSGVIGFHNIKTSDSPNVVVGRKGSIGNVYYLDVDFWAHDTSLYVTNFFGNNQKYIYYLFLYLELERFGTKSGSPSLNRNDIHPLKISLPKPMEQERISKMLSHFDTSISNLKSGLNKLQHQKNGLMQDLLTGKVRVTNLLKEKELTIP